MDKGYGPWYSYGRTKLMIAMSSYELARRLLDQGAPVTVNVGTHTEQETTSVHARECHV
jgi:hypothetical protein